MKRRRLPPPLFRLLTPLGLVAVASLLGLSAVALSPHLGGPILG